jgi:flagellar assembly protein FliH
MEQKTKWFNSLRRPPLWGAGQALEGERPKQASKARVLRGTYTLDEDSVQIGADETARRKISSSSLRPIRAETADEVRIEYDPSLYGITRIETVDEREARFQAEVDDLKAQLANVREEIETAQKHAHETGMQEGLAQGKQAAQEELQAEYDGKLQQVNELLDSIVSSTRDYYSRVERRLVQFALTIAQKVVGDAANSQEGIATRLAKEALIQARERTEVTLLCHPDDEAELTASGLDLKVVSEGIREIEVRTSHRMSRGSIILESNGGSIDATIETILEELHIALLGDEPPPNEDSE